MDQESIIKGYEEKYKNAFQLASFNVYNVLTNEIPTCPIGERQNPLISNEAIEQQWSFKYSKLNAYN